MAKGISIGIASDTREFTSGVKKGVIEPLEGASDALDDVAKDGDKAGKKLEKAFEKASEETSDFKKEQSELGKAMAAGSEKGGGALKRNTKDATSAASRDLETLGDEAKANLSETLSSFDGSAQGFADGIQGTLGGIVSDMGPMGMALGAAGALGIGLIMAAMGDAATATEEVKERTRDLASEYITTGDLGVASMDFLIGKLQDLATESDGINLAKLAKTAKDSGSSFKDLAQAYSGNAKGLKDLWREGDRYRKQLEDEADAQDTTTNAGGKRYSQLMKQADAQRTYMGYLGQSISVAKEAAEAEENYAKAGGRELELKAAAVENYQSAIDDAVGAYGDFVNEETKALEPQRYIDGINARIAATSSFNTNVQKMATDFGLSTEEVQALVDQGVDFAPMLQSIIDSGLGQQYVDTIRNAVGGGQDILDGADLTATLTVTPETAKAEEKLTEQEKKTRSTKVEAKADTTAADKQLDQVAAKPRTTTITAKLDTTAADRQLDKFVEERQVRIVATIVDTNGRKIT
ncbi:hypothetical protein [Glaciibacter psychrotolerans]|uniref:Tape measure protein n=1 Tax=Glaciibacter psychrotolerans TaxID=670054 RepID=A0A7Z0EG28_9MICO|nr:hypothetical protein [Leifsonia psychrotolerans]NYJ20806.1 hypothetical protein [Leifsonia psychrotolerans]